MEYIIEAITGVSVYIPMWVQVWTSVVSTVFMVFVILQLANIYLDGKIWRLYMQSAQLFRYQQDRKKWALTKTFEEWKYWHDNEA